MSRPCPSGVGAATASFVYDGDGQRVAMRDVDGTLYFLLRYHLRSAILLAKAAEDKMPLKLPVPDRALQANFVANGI